MQLRTIAWRDRLVHEYLWLRYSEKAVKIYKDDTLVAVHLRLRKPGQRSTKPEHLPPAALAYLMHDPQACLEKAEAVGSSCLEIVESLFSDKVLDKLRAVQGILGLEKKYGKKRLEAACNYALSHGVTARQGIKRILERGLDQQQQLIETPLSGVYIGKARFIRQAQRLQ